MPPIKTDAVHRYFNYDNIEKKSKCLICGNNLKGKHTTNLKNHLSLKHYNEYKSIMTINKENSKPQSKVSLERIKQLKHNCVKLVTIHGRPFAILQDQAFQDIIKMVTPSNAHEISIGSIKKLVIDKAYEVKLKISKEVRHKMISLKLDSATYVDRNFLGINMQYVKDGEIKVRNLAIVETIERQTGDFLKEKLIEILNDFMIDISQIYSITTDNGKNFKKMTTLLGCKLYSEDTDDTSEDEEMEEENERTQELELHDFENIININSFLDYINNSTIPPYKYKPRVMLCAAHTLQLAVRDAINVNIETQSIIELARKVVRILRRPTIKNILRVSNLKKPIIDCTTRWTSTYNMLERLFALKSVCDNNSEIANLLSTKFWDELSLTITCLKPINEATLSLQKKQITIGDFFIIWLTCKSRMEFFSIPFAQDLLKSMKEREKNLLNNNLVLENIYLDGRLNVILSDEECAKAQSLLQETYTQLQHIKESQVEENIINKDPHLMDQNQNTSSSQTFTTDIERILKQTEEERGLHFSKTASSFEITLKELRFAPRLAPTENIIKDWANKGTVSSTIAAVANTVLAAPATQVSVERLFSSLKFILSPLRSNMDGHLLQNVMLLRSNYDLYDDNLDSHS